MNIIDLIFGLGVFGGIILVIGSIYPVKKVKIPRNSVKNWLFASGAIVLFIYALLNYLYGTGTLFFAILEVIAIVSSFLMLSRFPAKISTKIILGLGFVLVGWSVLIAKNYSAVIFILGLTVISLGYVLPTGTLKRNLLLAIGSLLISLFSYLGNELVFLWINVFFAGFSLHHAWKLRKNQKF